MLARALILAFLLATGIIGLVAETFHTLAAAIGGLP